MYCMGIIIVASLIFTNLAISNTLPYNDTYTYDIMNINVTAYNNYFNLVYSDKAEIFEMEFYPRAYATAGLIHDRMNEKIKYEPNPEQIRKDLANMAIPITFESVIYTHYDASTTFGDIEMKNVESTHSPLILLLNDKLECDPGCGGIDAYYPSTELYIATHIDDNNKTLYDIYESNPTSLPKEKQNKYDEKPILTVAHNAFDLSDLMVIENFLFSIIAAIIIFSIIATIITISLVLFQEPNNCGEEIALFVITMAAGGIFAWCMVGIGIIIIAVILIFFFLKHFIDY
eukprot:277798_1